MSYPSLAPSRSTYDVRRRRRRMILLVIIGIVIALFALAVRYRTEERQTNEYLGLAVAIADNQAGLAESMTQMLTDLGSLERQDLLNQIDSLGAQVSTDVQRLADQDVPGSIVEIHGFLTVALAAWQDAITTMDDAVLLILDSPDDDPAGDAALSAVFELLQVGDVAFQKFVEARGELESDLGSEPIAMVDYVAAGAENLFDGETIANRLRVTLKLEGRHDISVTARTDPEPLGQQNGRPVVPTSETFAVLAVVTNEGNLPEQGISVTLQLGPVSGEVDAIVREELILSLDAGQATTVEFADLELLPGQLYDLQIAASITQDADPLNNVFELIFIRNQDA